MYRKIQDFPVFDISLGLANTMTVSSFILCPASRCLSVRQYHDGQLIHRWPIHALPDIEFSFGLTIAMTAIAFVIVFFICFSTAARFEDSIDPALWLTISLAY